MRKTKKALVSLPLLFLTLPLFCSAQVKDVYAIDHYATFVLNVPEDFEDDAYVIMIDSDGIAYELDFTNENNYIVEKKIESGTYYVAEGGSILERDNETKTYSTKTFSFNTSAVTMKINITLMDKTYSDLETVEYSLSEEKMSELGIENSSSVLEEYIVPTIDESKEAEETDIDYISLYESQKGKNSIQEETEAVAEEDTKQSGNKILDFIKNNLFVTVGFSVAIIGMIIYKIMTHEKEDEFGNR